MKNIQVRNNSSDELDSKYYFDFDPCPYQADFDGLQMSWGGKFCKPAIFKSAERKVCNKSFRRKSEGETLFRRGADSMTVWSLFLMGVDPCHTFPAIAYLNPKEIG